MTRYFTEDHEWIDMDGEVGTVGITDYAQTQLGDIVFVDVPEEGKELAKGVATLDVKVPLAQLTLTDGSPVNALNRGVIVHTAADDYKTQPTGNAGGRLACGVITAK